MKGLPSELKARERYLKEQRNRLLESKKKQRDEEMRRYQETHPQPQRSNRSPRKPEATSDVLGVVSAATTQQPAPAANTKTAPVGGRTQSRVLCSVIAKKLKEEHLVN